MMGTLHRVLLVNLIYYGSYNPISGGPFQKSVDAIISEHGSQDILVGCHFGDNLCLFECTLLAITIAEGQWPINISKNGLTSLCQSVPCC